MALQAPRVLRLTAQYKEFVGTEWQFCQMKAESLISLLKILKQCQLQEQLTKKRNITITALDIGAASIEQGNKADSAIQSIQGNGKIIQPDFNRSVVITPENIGAVPVERKINDKALNEDITLSASDIGAAAIEHGEHVPSVQAADNSIFLRNDNSWKPVTPKNIGAATEEQGQKACNSRNSSQRCVRFA